MHFFFVVTSMPHLPDEDQSALYENGIPFFETPLPIKIEPDLCQDKFPELIQFIFLGIPINLKAIEITCNEFAIPQREYTDG